MRFKGHLKALGDSVLGASKRTRPRVYVSSNDAVKGNYEPLMAWARKSDNGATPEALLHTN